MCTVWMVRALVLACLLSPLAALAGDITVDGSFKSTAPTGTPPLQVDSTTLVPNLNAELLNGLPASAFTTSVANVVRVGRAGADFTSIQAAIDSITDAGLDNWYVVTVGPGVYNESVTLKSFVSVVGHEFPATRIEVEGAGDITTVEGATLARLSDLWVIARSTDGSDATAMAVDTPGVRLVRTLLEAETASPGQAVGLRATGSGSATLEESSVLALNGDVNTGIYLETPAAVSVIGGVVNADSPANAGATNYGIRVVSVSGGGVVNLTDTSVVASSGDVEYALRSDQANINVVRSHLGTSASSLGVGIYSASSVDAFTVSDSTIRADTRAIENVDGDVDVQRTTLTAPSAIVLVSGSAVANVAYSRIGGLGVFSGAGTFNCIGLYDFNMAPVSCP